MNPDMYIAILENTENENELGSDHVVGPYPLDILKEKLKDETLSEYNVKKAKIIKTAV